MTEAIIVSLITGVFSVIAVGITNHHSNQKITLQLDKHLAVIDEKLKEMSDRMDKFDETAKLAYKHDKDIAVIKVKLNINE
jgi:hypothetical protein